MILLVGGTSEAIEIAGALDQAAKSYIMTVATEYGYQEATGKAAGKVLKGPFNGPAFSRLLADYSITVVVDAAHPFAGELRSELSAAAEAAGVRLVRLERPLNTYETDQDVACFDTPAALGAWVARQNFERILVTTGIKGLGALAGFLDLKKVYARMLPAEESLTAALKLGVEPSHIIAMEGPFSRELNEAIFRHLQIDLLITKDSGEAGGFTAKLEAALGCGCRVAVLRRPEPAHGEVYWNTQTLLESLGVAIKEIEGWHVLLLGHGSRLDSANCGLLLVAEELSKSDRFKGVTPAFLQNASPSLAESFQNIVESGGRRIVVMPLFLFEGVHITSDIPAEIDQMLQKYPGVQVVQASFIGPDPLLAKICLQRIKEALNSVF